MSIGGPKGPDAPKGLAKVLQLRTPALEKTEKVAETTKTEAPSTTTPTTTAQATSQTTSQTMPTATFEGTTGTQQTLAAPVDGAGQSQLLARLKARGKVTKTAANSGPSFVQTAEGKVHNGSVTVESKSGLSKLVDVVRVGGDLTIHEGVVKNADLLALKSLKSVERRLTFEGLRSS